MISISLALVATAMVSGCAQIIGADFSGLQPPEAATGGSAGQGDAGGDELTMGDDAEADGATEDVSTDGALAEAEVDESGGEDVEADGDRADVLADGTAMADAHGDAGVDVDVDVDANVLDGGVDASVDGPEGDAASDSEPPQDALAEAEPPQDVANESQPDQDATNDGPADAGLIATVVINEINGRGALPDYIELYNAGTETFDLAGYSVTQATNSIGAPDLPSRLIFPSGTTLAPGAFLVIVGNQTEVDGGPLKGGPFTPCNAVGLSLSSCYKVNWGISSGGEAVYLLDPAPNVKELVFFPGPPGAPAVPPPSWGRFPDGVPPLRGTAQTPGTANHL